MRPSRPGSRPVVGSSRKRRPGRLELGRQADSLALPARERGDSRSDLLVERGFVQHPGDGRVDLRRRRVARKAEPGGVPQGLEHGQPWVDDLVLRQIADVGQARLEGLPVDEDDAMRRPGGPHQHSHERRLPGAALADYRNELSRLDGERRSVENESLLDRHRDLVGVQTKRTAVVALHELAAVEDQAERPHADLGSGAQRLALNDLPVEAGPVSRAEVSELDAFVDPDHLGVEARDGRRVEANAVGGVTSESEP